MAIKIVEAERGVYAVIIEDLSNMDFTHTGSSRNKYEKAREKVLAFLTKKFDKVHAKAYPSSTGTPNAS